MLRQCRGERLGIHEELLDGDLRRVCVASVKDFLHRRRRRRRRMVWPGDDDGGRRRCQLLGGGGGGGDGFCRRMIGVGIGRSP